MWHDCVYCRKARNVEVVKPSLPCDLFTQSALNFRSQLRGRHCGRFLRALACCPASRRSFVLLALLKVISCTCNTVAGPTQICCIMFAMLSMFHIRLAVAQWLQAPSGSHCAKCVHSFWSLIQLILLENQPCGHVFCDNCECQSACTGQPIGAFSRRADVCHGPPAQGKGPQQAHKTWEEI